VLPVGEHLLQNPNFLDTHVKICPGSAWGFKIHDLIVWFGSGRLSYQGKENLLMLTLNVTKAHLCSCLLSLIPSGTSDTSCFFSGLY